MQGESAKRTIAWEQEKIELRSRHEFDMQEQRKELENQLEIDSDMRQKLKLDSKVQSLRDAHERGQISEKEMNDEILRMELGIPASLSPLYKKKDESNALTRFLDELGEREGGVTAPTGIKPIRAINKETGQRIVSYDGGKTWQ